MARAIDITVKLTSKTGLVFAEKIQQQIAAEVHQKNRVLSRDWLRRVRIYPPTGPGNKPPTPYWKRGTGMIRWDGSVNPVSQDYRNSWQVNQVDTPFGGTLTMETPVTYAPYLIDNVKQAKNHKVTGWQTIEQMATAIGIKVTRESDVLYSITDAGRYYEGVLKKAQQIFSY